MDNNNRRLIFIQIILPFLMCLVVSALSISPVLAQSEQEHMQNGMVLAQQGKLDQAIIEFQAALKMNPKDIAAHVILGQIYQQMGRNQSGLKEIRTAVNLNPTSPDLYNDLGSAYLNANTPNLAVEAFRHSLVLKPNQSEPYIGMGDAYKQMNDFPDSENAYIMALGINPDQSVVPFALGQLYAYFKHPNKAIPEYEAALRIKPDYSMAKAALISAMNDAKRYKDSISIANKFLIETPNDSDIEEQLAFAYSGEKNYPLALKTYQLVINAAPNNPTSWGNYGWLEYLAGNIQNAISYSQKALTFNPKLAYVKYNLGLYYAVSGNESLAMQTYKDGFIIASQDDTVNAMPDLKKAIEKHPDNAILKEALRLLETLAKSYK